MELLLQYLRLKWTGLLSGQRVIRYHACFILHEPKNTLIQRIRKKGRYEPFVEDFCRRVLPDDGLFVDAGANIGLIALPLLKAKPGTKALLFEPSPIAYRLLIKNVALNSFSKRVMAFDCALAAENRDEVPFAVNEYPDRSMDGLIFTARTKGSKTILVSQRILDNVIEEMSVSRLDLIKLDCEGAELLVLQGAKRCVERFRPIIMMEFSQLNYLKYNLSANMLWDWVQDANYLLLTPMMNLLDLYTLEIHIGALLEGQFILIPKGYPWRGI